MMFEPDAVLSPCVGVCALGNDGLCLGCLRTGAEIAAWSALDETTRLHFMDVVLPARAERRQTP